MSLAGLDKIMATINQRPLAPKPNTEPRGQGGNNNAAYLSMVDFALNGVSNTHPSPGYRIPPPPPERHRNCRNCGASKFKGGKCEYCGSEV